MARTSLQHMLWTWQRNINGMTQQHQTSNKSKIHNVTTIKIRKLPNFNSIVIAECCRHPGEYTAENQRHCTANMYNITQVLNSTASILQSSPKFPTSNTQVPKYKIINGPRPQIKSPNRTINIPVLKSKSQVQKSNTSIQWHTNIQDISHDRVNVPGCTWICASVCLCVLVVLILKLIEHYILLPTECGKVCVVVGWLRPYPQCR